MNLGKSKYPAGMAPKSLTRTVSADGDTVTYKFDGTGADGTAFSYGFTSKYDGKDSEITGTGMPFGADHGHQAGELAHAFLYDEKGR